MNDSSTAAPPGKFRFRLGDLIIDPGRQCVTRGTEVIALPKLSYELLMALVQAAPDLVSNDALMDQVWPKLVVSPETLSQRIKLLRDALGDDPRKPRYVEGLRGRGYRLIAPVTREPVPAIEATAPTIQSATAPAIESGGKIPSRPSPQRKQIAHPWLASAALGAVVLASFFALHKRSDTTSPARGGSVEVVAVPPRAIAVLPFDNLSTDAGNEYIALGIAESVLNRLGSIREMIVIARSSAFSLGTTVLDAREAGRRLGARYVVEGSVQRAGNKLRVNAQLIDALSNHQLWALSFDRTIDDIFAVQDEIAQRVAEKLEVSLQAPSAAYERYGTDAYFAFLKGRALLESRKIASVQESIQDFSLAIQRAPTFAAAMVELAYAKLLLAELRGDSKEDTRALWTELRSLADRAIELDPGAGEPYYLRGLYKLDVQQDVAAADLDFHKGEELAPNYVRGVDTITIRLMEQGRVADIIQMMDRASLVDPLSPRLHYLKGEMLRRAYGDWQHASEAYLRALAVAPDFYPAQTRLAQIFWYQGKLADAIKYAESSVAIEPNIAWTRARLVWFYVDIGDLDAARDVMRGFNAGSISESTHQALICYRAGNLVRADRLARKALTDPGVQEERLAFYLAIAAVVERAIQVQAADSARQAILAIPELQKDGGTLAVVAANFPTVVRLAALEHAVGDDNVAKDLAERIIKLLDAEPSGHGEQDERDRAAALTILGRNAEALSHLETWMRAGRRNHWWETIGHDPSFSALRATPRFKAIASEAHSWIGGQQQQLQQMRLHGEVPTRSAPAQADGC